MYYNGGTIYDDVDLWEFDAKTRILKEAKQLKISNQEIEKLNHHIQRVVNNEY